MLTLNDYYDSIGASLIQRYFSVGGNFRGELLNEFCLIEYFIEDSIASYLYYTDSSKNKHDKLFEILSKRIKSFDLKIEIYLDLFSSEFPQVESIYNSLMKEKYSQYKHKSLFDLRNVMAHWNLAGTDEHLKKYKQNGEICFVQRSFSNDKNYFENSFSLNGENLNQLKEKLVVIKNNLEAICNLIRSKQGLSPSNKYE